jgi:hypothetical protein
VRLTARDASRRGEGFVRLEHRGAPVFLSFSREVVDLAAKLETPNFDIRDHLFSALPIVLYIRWAFRESAWRAPERGACLIIDDPLLTPRYGFVRYTQLLALMREHNFSTSIAFIPWNWRRSDPDVAQLFTEHADRLSLCVHGCDHTAAEFGSGDARRQRWLAKEALARMARHATHTGVAHDAVMVFPQGVFSAQASPALKAAGFTAVVNTEVHAVPPGKESVTIGDVWNVAVMHYGDFPLYTRRYPRQGVDNQAFDLLLGKPCFIVIHHDFCSDGCARLVEFVDQLNALPGGLSWRSPAEVVKRSYRMREAVDGATELEMYGSELLIENSAVVPKHFRIRRRERDPSAVEQVLDGGATLSWNASNGYLEFETSLRPNERKEIRICFRRPPDGEEAQPAASRLKTSLRRYLSEARDNYVVPAKAWLRPASR